MTHSTHPQIPQAGVLVLLPVYNGARFLAQQLDSILAQSLPGVQVLCRDDGSSDGSPQLLADYAQRHPQRIVVQSDATGNVGASRNFSLLMQAALQFQDPASGARPGYFALADQDDLWQAHKLQRLLERLREEEAIAPGTPVIVHSDLRVVAHDGSVIAPSMATYQGLRTDRSSFSAQLVSNTVTGCTVLMNRALLSKSTPVAPESIMHDWWISLVASAFGRRVYLQEALVDYRQHDNNTIGAKEWVKPVVRRNFISRLFENDHAQTFRMNARQALAFQRVHGSALGLGQKAVLWLATRLDIPFPPLQRVLYRLLRVL